MTITKEDLKISLKHPIDVVTQVRDFGNGAWLIRIVTDGKPVEFINGDFPEKCQICGKRIYQWMTISKNHPDVDTVVKTKLNMHHTTYINPKKEDFLFLCNGCHGRLTGLITNIIYQWLKHEEIYKHINAMAVKELKRHIQKVKY
jgi:hypothetical protein